METNLRVLIADEDEDALEVLRATLEQLGHEVMPFAVSVSEAIELISREDPNLTIVMVHQDDEHALLLIAEAVEFASGPVIATVRDGDADFLARAAEHGIAAYVQGTDPESVQGAIEVALRRYRETAHLAGKVDQLEGALQRRVVIERAKGILMERHSADERAGVRAAARERAGELASGGGGGAVGGRRARAAAARRGMSPADDPRPGKRLVPSDFTRAFKRFQSDQMTDRAAALTYYSLLSLFPALLFGVAALGYFGRQQLITDASNYLLEAGAPKETVSSVTKALESAQSQRGTAFTALVIALGTSLWGASGAFGAVGRALNVVWRVEEGRNFVRKKLYDLGWTLALLVLILLTFVLIFVGATWPTTCWARSGSARWPTARGRSPAGRRRWCWPCSSTRSSTTRRRTWRSRASSSSPRAR